MHFALCRLGAACRMATTVLCTASLARLHPLDGMWCRCRDGHARRESGVAYPSELAALIAATAADWTHREQSKVSWVVGLALNPCEGVLALSDDGPKRPPELKWFITVRPANTKV